MLEYVDRRELTKQVAREIRRHRPDAVLSIDPGAPYEQWHKSDHRSGAVITADAPDRPLWTSWVTFTPTATLGAA